MGKPSALFLFGTWTGIVERIDLLQTTKWTILGNVALANTPQLAISIAYCLWNSQMTVMFAARMPLAATCSGALSAACHPRDPVARHYLDKVHWGIEMSDEGEADQRQSSGNKIAHCTFTSGAARYPDSDRLCA